MQRPCGRGDGWRPAWLVHSQRKHGRNEAGNGAGGMYLASGVPVEGFVWIL